MECVIPNLRLTLLHYTGEYERLMARLRAFQASEGSNVAVHECSGDEAQAANYFRLGARVGVSSP